MAAPVFRAAGAKSAGTTGNITVAAPAGVATGDLELLVVETLDTSTVSITNNGGSAWTVMTETPVSVGSGSKLYVWWRIRQSGDGDPIVQASADHVDAARLAYQTGTFNTSDPFEIEITSAEGTSDTSFSWAPGTSTGGVDRLVLVISTIRRDSNTASVPVCTNSALTSLASRANYCTNSGLGGGFGITEGTKASAGGVGTFACTYAAASVKAYLSFAIKPVSITDHALAVTDDLSLSIASAFGAVEKVLAVTMPLDLSIASALNAVEKPLAVTDDLNLAISTGIGRETFLAVTDDLGLSIFTEIVTVVDHPLAVTDDLGLGISSALTRELLLSATDDLGLTISTALTRELLVAVADALGLTISTSLTSELLIAVTDALGLQIDSTFTRETFLAALVDLGLGISTDLTLGAAGGTAVVGHSQGRALSPAQRRRLREEEDEAEMIASILSRL